MDRFRYVIDKHLQTFLSDLHCFVIDRENSRGQQEQHVRTVAWCKDQFGEPSDFTDKTGRWCANGFRIFFRNPTDATVFRLRWC